MKRVEKSKGCTANARGVIDTNLPKVEYALEKIFIKARERCIFAQERLVDGACGNQ
jgi:hypothetical protein